MATSRGPHGSRARRELIGGWVAAVIAVLAVVGLFQVSDPGSGYESAPRPLSLHAGSG
jgi:hypothetical protein